MVKFLNVGYLLTLSLVVSSTFAYASASNSQDGETTPPKFLRIKDRPQVLKNEISEYFKRVSVSTIDTSSWLFNGNDRYCSFGAIDEVEFFEAMLQTRPDRVDDYYLLDLGAGNFTWGKSVAEYVNTYLAGKLKGEQNIHIVSVTGERSGASHAPKQVGKCVLHNIGSFPIEHLERCLTNTIGSEVRFDLIVSSFTFIHLNDPLGTFLQAYNRLATEGFMMCQGFPVDYAKSRSYQGKMQNFYLAHTLLTTGEPFLMQPGFSNNVDFPNFLLKRTQAENLQLPFTYASDLRMNLALQQTAPTNRAKYNFHNVPESSKNMNMDCFQENYCFARGNSPELFNWIYAHYAPWQVMDVKWESIFKGSSNPVIEHFKPPIRKAMWKSLDEFTQYVTPELSRSYKDPTGTPLLHYFNNPALLDKLKYLLEAGFDPNVMDRDNKTLLHEIASAAEFPGYTKVLEATLRYGACVDVPNREGDTPLHLAVMAAESVADLEQAFTLIRSGADTTIKNHSQKCPLDLAQTPELKAKLLTVIAERN